jgi:hypothetical protein
MQGAYRNQPTKALRGESWGDVSKLMRLVPFTALDRMTIARELQPVLLLTAPMPELREDRTGR